MKSDSIVKIIMNNYDDSQASKAIIDDRTSMPKDIWLDVTLKDFKKLLQKYPQLIGMLRQMEIQHGYLAKQQLADMIMAFFDWNHVNSFHKGRLFTPHQYLTPYRAPLSDDQIPVESDNLGKQYDDKTICDGSLENLLL